MRALPVLKRQLCANTGREQVQQTTRLFNHGVDAARDFT
jgi:hypothetical protein